MAYGNTSVSALLNQARSALKKQQGLEEEIAAYEYDLSPKDQASFNKYQDFLAQRIKQVQSTDPSKSLSLQRKITGAQRTFSSAELTRESIGIAEGTGSKPQKLQKMISLYRQALENGDENLAQRIQLQADSLQVQIQNEASARGAGGGGAAKDTTDAGKGIEKAMSDFDLAKTSLDDDFRNGRVDQATYIDKMSKINDAKNTTLKSAYTIDAENNVLPNGNGISLKEAENFYKDRVKLRNDESYQKLMGTDENVPFDIRRAQINGAFKSSVDPLTGEIKLEKNNITGIRRLAELGATQGAFNTTDQVDGAKFKAGFGGLGLSGGESGSIKRTYDNYSGASAGEGTFYLNDVNNPTYAYTQDKNNVRYALDKEGKAVMLGDSLAADKQIGELKAKLAAGQITPEEYATQVKNVNTDMLPPDLLTGMQDAKDANFGGLGGVGRRMGVNAGKVLDSYKKQSALKRITELGGNLGLSNPLASLAGFTGSTVGALGKIGDLTQQLTGLKQKSDAKNAADAAQRAAEFQAHQQAIAEANASSAAYAAKAKAQGRENVVLPYKATPAGQKAANTVGTKDFNEKFLGGPNSLYNKYLR